MKKIILSLTIILSVFMAKADEGMWLLSQLHKNFAKMQEMGLKLSIEEIYSINNASMKDAVVIFGGGCTGEIISDRGLLLTNHHCGYGSVQALSSPQNNILENGFWAKTYTDELPCENLSVSFFIRMEEVTDIILEGISDATPEKERGETIRTRSQELQRKYAEDGKYSVRISAMFDGNTYYMFIYQVYRDVRLVGVPPENMGKFGGDTDNWMWPRHTADFSLFRVYTDKDGNPAAYNQNNIPMQPKWFFPVSTAGFKENDFAMIVGFPGSTDRFLPSYGVKMAIDEKNPTIVKVRDVKLASWREFRKSDKVIDLQYASKFAGIANYWKYFIGQTQQLVNNNVIAKKEAIEEDFQTWVNHNNKKEYYNVVSNIDAAYNEISKVEKFSNLYSQAIFSGPEIFSLSRSYTAVYALLKKQEDKTITDAEKKQLETRLPQLKSSLDRFFKNYNVNVDKATTAKVLELFFNESTPEQRPPAFNDAVKKAKGDFTKLTENLFAKTMFGNKDLILKFLDKPTTKHLDKDLAYTWYNLFYDFYRNVMQPITPAYEKLEVANRLFVRGLLEMNPEKLYSPNANSQIRLTYGKVGGYPISDGLHANFYTTLDGVMAKENPTVDEFTIPAKLREVYKSKDYGDYAENGQIRACFLTDNDITGGNSGSPVINAKGELIGCAFDGNWEAMSGDIFFEPRVQKTISVDIRYVLFIIDKIGGAKHLVEEMKIVRD